MVDLSHNVAWEYREGPSLGQYVQREIHPSEANELRAAASITGQHSGAGLLKVLGQRGKARQRRYTRLDESESDEDGLATDQTDNASRVPELNRGKRQWCRRCCQLMAAAARSVELAHSWMPQKAMANLAFRAGTLLHVLAMTGRH